MAFKVYNPSAGRWFILHWWTDHDRGHVSFAKTVDELKEVARRVFTKEPEAQNRGLYEIEMVGPPPRVEELAAKHDRTEKVDQFYYEVAARMSELIEHKRKLPAPFEQCLKFEPENSENGRDGWAGERHYDCKNCSMRLKMNVTREEFYVQYADRWYDLHPPFKSKPSPKMPKRVPSLAAPARDDEEIWFAYGNFGHHAGGIELEKVDLKDGEDYRKHCCGDQALFFYRLIGRVAKANLPAAIEISKIISDVKAADKKATKEDQAKRKADRRAEEQKRIRETVEFFR